LLPANLSPQEYLPALDIALEMQHNGKSLQALDFMNKLMAAHPDAPSVEYATAVAAFQAGFRKEADRLADASIKKGSRLADSWILKAAIATSQSEGSAAKQEYLLREAISADPMNPDGFIELAALMRYLGKNAEASALLSSAALRLDAAEPLSVVETTRAILAIDLSEKLTPPADPIGVPSKDIPNAYSEMKRGDFVKAASILRFCREHTNPQLFAYLLHDPSLKKFSSQSELKEFY
jgi:tetratricopeptide (TPR) repeat protein